MKLGCIMFALIILRQPLQPDTCGKLDMVKNVYKDPTIHSAWISSYYDQEVVRTSGIRLCQDMDLCKGMRKHNGGSGIGKLEERNPPKNLLQGSHDRRPVDDLNTYVSKRL